MIIVKLEEEEATRLRYLIYDHLEYLKENSEDELIKAYNIIVSKLSGGIT